MDWNRLYEVEKRRKEIYEQGALIRVRGYIAKNVVLKKLFIGNSFVKCLRDNIDDALMEAMKEQGIYRAPFEYVNAINRGVPAELHNCYVKIGENDFFNGKFNFRYCRYHLIDKIHVIAKNQVKLLIKLGDIRYIFDIPSGKTTLDIKLYMTNTLICYCTVYLEVLNGDIENIFIASIFIDPRCKIGDLLFRSIDTFVSMPLATFYNRYGGEIAICDLKEITFIYDNRSRIIDIKISDETHLKKCLRYYTPVFPELALIDGAYINHDMIDNLSSGKKELIETFHLATKNRSSLLWMLPNELLDLIAGNCLVYKIESKLCIGMFYQNELEYLQLLFIGR